MDNISTTTFEVEIKKCAEDFVYFCETYIKIIHPTKGLVPFKLHDFQKRYASDIDNHRFVIAKKFRQGGFTTTTLAWLVWRFIFKTDESNMVMCRTDREAINHNDIVRNIISFLPDFLRPSFKKCNDHYLHNESTDSRLYFHTPEAACGRALNYLFIDEAAFIYNMESHWKAMYPTLSTGGHCIAISTINGTGNWFHQTYKNAVGRFNNFYVFHSVYTEHPDYNNPEWVENVKNNLGPRGWRQEIMCEFEDEDEDLDVNTGGDVDVNTGGDVDVPDDIEMPKFGETKRPHLDDKSEDIPDPIKAIFSKAEKDKSFKFVKSLNEEVELLRAFRRKAAEDGVNMNKGQLGNIKDNPEPPKLSFETSPDGHTGTMVSFSHVQRPNTFTEYWWPDVAEEIAEEHIFVYDDHSLANCIERKKQNLKDLEDRINVNEYPHDLLVLAGVIDDNNDSESYTEEIFTGESIDKEILDKVMKIGNFPKNLKVSFSNKKFCVNDVPTNIGEFDLCCLHTGMIAFTSHEKAVLKIAKLICKRMMPLFGLREGKHVKQ